MKDISPLAIWPGDESLFQFKVVVAGDFAGGLLANLELPALPPAGTAASAWTATRTRVRIGTEPVPVYQLETRLLDQPIIIEVSTLGEILSVQLPGNVSARIDEWSRP